MKMQVSQMMAEMLNAQLPYETEAQQTILLSIAKKVYTKVRNSRMPYEVVEEMGMKIRERDWFYMSMTFSKPGLQAIARSL